MRRPGTMQAWTPGGVPLGSATCCPADNHDPDSRSRLVLQKPGYMKNLTSC